MFLLMPDHSQVLKWKFQVGVKVPWMSLPKDPESVSKLGP